MSVKLICQILVMAACTTNFFGFVWWDFNGKPARKAMGFPGFIASLIVTTIIVGSLYGAGAFSEIIP